MGPVFCLLPSAYSFLFFRIRPRRHHHRDRLPRRCPVLPDRVQPLRARLHTLRRKHFRLYPCPYPHGHQLHTRDMFQSALPYLQENLLGSDSLIILPEVLLDSNNLTAPVAFCNTLFPAFATTKTDQRLSSNKSEPPASAGGL